MWMTFDDEFEELAALAYQTAFRILGSRSEAEEVAQDTMTKAYVRWRRVQSHARPWVCRVAVNGALGVLRRRRDTEPHQSMPDESLQTGVADRVDLQRLLSSLSRRQRDVVALRYLADMPEADVAAELGISVGTVKTHAHRGIELLRQRLDSSTSLTTPAETPGMAVMEQKEPTDV
jgi:RNA polymerase sigma factor (sigma-70 family)